MTAIVCVSQNWGIGKDNRLLFHISADLKRFRSLTTGKTVLLGSKTLATFPGGRPLPNRRNIILTHRSLTIEGAEIAHSVEEALSLAGQDAVVIGGSSVYAAFLPYCDRIFVTKVAVSPEADCFFPDLDYSSDWEIEQQSEPMEENGIVFRYIDYIRKK